MPTLGNLTVDDRRRGLEFADRVAALAADAPDAVTKAIVYAARNTILKQYGFAREEKKAEILRLINLGAAQIADLIRESNFHRDDVYELTRELEAEGKLRCQQMRLTGGNGRPSICFFPVEN